VEVVEFRLFLRGLIGGILIRSGLVRRLNFGFLLTAAAATTAFGTLGRLAACVLFTRWGNA
jgi:hypothetical protein